MNLAKALEIVEVDGPCPTRNESNKKRNQCVQAWVFLSTYLTDTERFDAINAYRKKMTDGKGVYNTVMAAIRTRLETEGKI